MQARPIPEDDEMQQSNDEITLLQAPSEGSPFDETETTIVVQLVGHDKEGALSIPPKPFSFGSEDSEMPTSDDPLGPDTKHANETKPCDSLAEPKEQKRKPSRGWRKPVAAVASVAALILSAAMCLGVIAMDSMETGSSPVVAKGVGG